MSDFDKAARYQIKQEPAGFVRWLFRPTAAPLHFHGWIDARRLALPAEGDLTCDTVADLRVPEQNTAAWALILEVQAESRAELIQRLLGYTVRLQSELSVNTDGIAWQVGGAVVNLTGPAQPDGMTLALPGVPACELRFRILQRTLRDESAADTLALIAAGEVTRWLLPWIPLMQGGAEAAIMGQWKAIAESEADRRIRAIWASLTLVFAELANRAEPWERALEGWNVQKSMYIESWREEGRKEGRVEGREEGRLQILRDLIQRMLADKFGTLPTELVERIQAMADEARLNAIFEQAMHIQALEDLQL
jgi:uncharacterized protein DUF4351